MREKILWSVVLLSLILAFAHAQSPARPEALVGRYQIVTVQGSGTEEAQAFKIDTVTGKTWAKVHGANDIIEWAIMRDFAAHQQ